MTDKISRHAFSSRIDLRENPAGSSCIEPTSSVFQSLEKSFPSIGKSLCFLFMSYLFTAFIAPGGGELILILLVLILLFGAKDAPRILRDIQNVLNKLQRSAADFRYKLMYGDLHWNQTEESKDTTVYDEKDSPETQDHDLPPENPPANEPEKHEDSV